MQEMPETVGREEYLQKRAEMEFYGAVNSRLGRKVEWGIGAMGSFLELAKAKNGKGLIKWNAETSKGLREIGVSEEKASKKTAVMIGNALLPLD